MRHVRLLKRYQVDRTPGITSGGQTELVMVILTDNDGVEFAVAMSSLDAKLLSDQIAKAALEAQAARLAK